MARAIYYALDLSTTAVLAIATNTSLGGLPVLASLLARDHLLPHVFGLRGDRPVYRYGVVTLAVRAGDAARRRRQHQRPHPLFALGCSRHQDHSQVLVLISEVEPKKWRHQLLQNQRGILLTSALRRRCDVNVARIPSASTRGSRKRRAGAWMVHRSRRPCNRLRTGWNGAANLPVWW